MGTCSPKFSDPLLRMRFDQSPNREKRTARRPQCLRVSASLCVRLLSDNRHSSPRLPNPPRCRDTTSCVGVGSLRAEKQRVKKHRCHNCSAEKPLHSIGLRDFLLQESPVNTRLFCVMQESGRTQDFVSTVFPPVTNKSSTACWGSPSRALLQTPKAGKKGPKTGSAAAIFKGLEPVDVARN